MDLKDPTMTVLEVRRAERVRSFLRARILFNNHNTTVDCVVKNLSATGAKIEIDAATTLPGEFEVDIPQKGKVFHARMVWRDRSFIGVAFAEPPADPIDGIDPVVDKLQRENRRLKTQLSMLKKRLEDLGQDVTFEP